MKAYYINPVDNKIHSGSYDVLKLDSNLHYFGVKFFPTYKQVKQFKNDLKTI